MASNSEGVVVRYREVTGNGWGGGRREEEMKRKGLRGWFLRLRGSNVMKEGELGYIILYYAYLHFFILKLMLLSINFKT